MKNPMNYDALKRTHATVPQAELTLARRGNNVRGAFVAKPEFALKHVALVDDVMTTGSTLNAAAMALKQVGVARVDVVAFARAGRVFTGS